MPKPTPCGSWSSPIPASMLATGQLRLGGAQVRGDRVAWIEGRPTEGGRSVVVRLSPGAEPADAVPDSFNARTRVHEYGGGAYVLGDDVLYASNFSDQLLHRIREGADPEPLTQPGFRYADGVLNGPGDRLYLVEEDHTGEGEAVNRVVLLDLSGDAPQRAVIAEGNDFYAGPRLSPDGSELAWSTWNHPDMPWDRSEVWVTALDGSGQGRESARVAGGEGVSAGQPCWGPDGTLVYVSDRSGFWNLYRRGDEASLCPKDAEFAEPHWVFGSPSYAFAGAGRLVVTWTEGGAWRLGLLETASRELKPLELPYTELHGVAATETHAVLCAASSTDMGGVVRVDLASGAHEVLRSAGSLEVDPAHLSVPQALEFPTTGDRTAHALYYAPRNTGHSVPEGERPPLLVLSHGGPTSSTSTALRLGIQYWTTRGFAVVDVNYGGSSGYGRAYRERLKGTWGIVDVDDCVAAAQHLVGRGLADPERLAIRGGSAGGYTTLCALTFRDVFKAGASHFGVSDLAALAKDTHKFESRYLDGLIGPYPEREDLYVERSPIHHTDRLDTPTILLQGLEDAVVPPNQAEMMVDALREKGVPVAYVPFEGEQHGFRKAENIVRAQEAELTFYGRVFGFEPAGDLPPLEIVNLP